MYIYIPIFLCNCCFWGLLIIRVLIKVAWCSHLLFGLLGILHMLHAQAQGGTKRHAQ